MNKGHRESYKKYTPNYAPKFAVSSLNMLMNLSCPNHHRSPALPPVGGLGHPRLKVKPACELIDC